MLQAATTWSWTSDDGDAVADGRDPERAVIADAAAAAGRSGGGLVVVSGAPGIGRTTLLTAAGSSLARRGVTVRLAHGRADAAAHQVVEELLGPVGPPLRSTAPGAPADGGYAVLDRVFRRASRAMTGGVLALLVDDADLSDEPSVRCLDFLMRRAADLPLLVVLSHVTRPSGPEGGLLQLVAAHRTYAAFELPPLHDAALARVITRRMGQEPDPGFLTVCAEITGGHPGTLSALVDALDVQGVGPVGTSVRQAAEIGSDLLARMALEFLRAQPENVSQVARAVAVLGPMAGGLLGSLLEMSAIAVERTIAVLRAQGMLAPDRVEFANGVVRQAVVAQLPTQDMHALRLRAARLLHDESGPAPEIARLLMLLPEHDEPWMFATLWEASVEARRSGQTAWSRRLLARAVDATPNDVASTTELANALSAFDPEAAIPHLVRAIRALRGTGALEHTSLVERLGELMLSSPPRSAMFGVLADAVDAGSAGDASRLRDSDPDLYRRVESANLAAGLGDRATLPAALVRARSIAVPEGTTPADRTLLGQLARAALFDGRPAAEVVRLGRAALAGPPSVLELDNSVIAAALALHQAGVPGEALTAITAALDNSGATGAAWLRCEAHRARALILAETGELPVAAREARTALMIAGREPWMSPRLAAAAVLLEQGKIGRADQFLGEVAAAWSTGPRGQAVGMFRARARYERGDYSGAATVLQRTFRVPLKGPFPLVASYWPAMAGLVARSTSVAAISASIESQLEEAERWGTRESTAGALLVRSLLVQGGRRLALAGEAVALLEDSPFVLHRLRAEYLFGHALLMSDDVAGARRYARQVTVSAVQCGYTGLGHKARDLLLAAGGRMKELGDSRADVLTASERRVAGFAAGGASNKDIAARLFITLRTVELHLSSTYRKLGVTSRRQLRALLGDQAAGSAPGLREVAG